MHIYLFFCFLLASFTKVFSFWYTLVDFLFISFCFCVIYLCFAILQLRSHFISSAISILMQCLVLISVQTVNIFLYNFLFVLLFVEMCYIALLIIYCCFLTFISSILFIFFFFLIFSVCYLYYCFVFFRFCLL